MSSWGSCATTFNKVSIKSPTRLHLTTRLTMSGPTKCVKWSQRCCDWKQRDKVELLKLIGEPWGTIHDSCLDARLQLPFTHPLMTVRISYVLSSLPIPEGLRVTPIWWPTCQTKHRYHIFGSCSYLGISKLALLVLVSRPERWLWHLWSTQVLQRPYLQRL